MKLVDTREAAKMLRLSPSTLAKWRCYGQGPAFVRVGARVFYESAELERFIERNRCRSTSDRPRWTKGQNR